MSKSAAAKLARAIADTRQNAAFIKRTGLCVSCREQPVYTIPGTNQTAMTCGRMQCRRAYLLWELVRCPRCQSLDFWRLVFQEDERGNKLYKCRNCGVITESKRKSQQFEVIEAHESEGTE